MSKVKLCKYCKTELPAGAKICPQCGKKQGMKLVFKIFIVLFVLGIIGASLENTEEPDTNVAETLDSSTENTVEETSESEEPSPAEEPDDSIPTEYKSALNKATSYSEMMHMSKAAIYAQLTSEYGEQFTSEAAQYAIDNMEADWNANALAKAEDYSNSMHMSKAGIYDQLTSEYGEQFTAEEAQYAIDNIQADWNENALKKAQSYQESMDMSPAAIHDQLTSEYGEKFTTEEADYAIENLK